MKDVKFIKEYKISLVNATPLKIGNGKDQLDLLIDKNTGVPIILGSSIAGAVKSYLLDLGYEDEVEKLLGSESDFKCESKIYIFDSYGGDFKISKRTGIQRDYKYGTNKERAIYTIDFIDSGTKFDFKFKLFAKDKEELEVEDNLLNIIIFGFKNKSLRLGSNKMSGFGGFDVEKVLFKEYNLSKQEDLISYILDDKKYTSLELKNLKEGINEGYVIFNFKGSIVDSMIVKQYIENKDIKSMNMVNSKKESIIPGTTIKGLLRGYNTKILNTLNKDLSIIDSIYGSSPDAAQKMRSKDEEVKLTIGKVLTSDVVIENPKYRVYNRIKVDRFTGGTITGSKFNEKRVQGDINFTIYLRKLDKNNQAAIGLILLTLRDLGLERLHIGSSSSVGAGRIKGEKITVKDGEKTVIIDFKEGKLSLNDRDYVNKAIGAISKIGGSN